MVPGLHHYLHVTVRVIEHSWVHVNHDFLCAAVNCGNPGEPVNGDTLGTTTTLDSVVTHTCDRGYVLSGARRRVCLPNGTWSQPLPSCVGNL